MDYLKYVNIKQGTKSSARFSHGNTLPLTCLPFAMNNFTVQTNGDNKPWFYDPDAKWIEGIRLTHQPSPWISDYGSILFCLQSNIPGTDLRGIWSGFDKNKAIMTPYRLSVNFKKSNSQMDLAPTKRGAIFNMHFMDVRQSYFSLMLFGIKDYITYDEKSGWLTGYTTHAHSKDLEEKEFKTFFAVKFKTDDVDSKNILISQKKHELELSNVAKGDYISIHIPIINKQATCSLSTSYISLEQAKLNHKRELEGKAFEEIEEIAYEEWNEKLNRIQVTTETLDEMKTFYTCLYRCFVFPHVCHEYDLEEKPIHYSPFENKVLPGVRYTDMGFWDTFRTLFPLFSIIAKDEYTDMVTGFINDYKASGWLPRWTTMTETGTMPSTLIDPVIADAYIKDIIDDKTAQIALEAMIKHANVKSKDPKFGRSGVEDYVKLGYVSYENEKESVNLTIDAAYGDYCIYLIANKLGMNDISDKYLKRSKNYINLFDKQSGFMRAKDSKGQFRPDFNMFNWGRDYTEGSAWQNSFGVHHDFEGLAELYGGKEEFLEKMNLIFETPPLYYADFYNREIHEMTEMALADFGQCAISNQPSFHLPYIFAYFNNQEKTDYWVKKICKEAFSYTKEGFPGDEDNGSMSAWYIFSMLGLFPICPGKAEYVKGPMQVKSAKILSKKWSNSTFNNLIPHQVFKE